ncbi:alkaline phosphatase family protein [Alicyclobacillus fastidiosus]|uniref:alkaline phosphatase family protein n=1 Tax=Alicyclobacillus fastidiosus TaxID=392011 RepID=UPI0024E09EA4|nr:alkaline phosphatase family protein [Alicyclobacillus fastidiosus]
MSTVFASSPIPKTPQTQVISGAKTTTPIKHVVVIFGENVSFDHYFGTYPHATNPRANRSSHRLQIHRPSMV